MGLFNLFKKKEKEKKKKYEKNSIYGKWEDGLISAEDVMLYSTFNFYKHALDYMWHINNVKKMVAEHNEKIPHMQDILNDVLSAGDYAGRWIDIGLLQYHKNDKKDELDINTAKCYVVIGGSCALDMIDSCKEIRDDVELDWSKESILKYCRLEILRECVIEEKLEKSSIVTTKEELLALTPTEEQLGLFYDACATNCRMLEKTNKENKDWYVDDLFTDEWLLQLPDENGVYHVVEENYFSDYIEMDYKGVV